MADTKHRNGERLQTVIIGGGVCGLAIGWQLAEAGQQVTLLERERCGQAATHAAAGMLAAAAECEPGEEQLLQLTRWAQELWPTFLDRLEAASGLRPDYRDEGTLVVALNRDEVDRLRFRHDFQSALGLPLQWLEGREVREREPHLRQSAAAAIYSLEDHQVDNRQLAEGLKRAFVNAGGELREHTEVAALDCPEDSAKRIHLANGEVLQAEHLVLAAGAWTRGLPGLPDAAKPPVRPLKGQSLALQMDPAAPLLEHVLWTEQVYCVPRRDGRLIIGATVEERGFDDSVTAGGLYALIEGARRALPGIEDLPLLESWSGFRPGCRDDAPVLGSTPVPGLHLATGHHRNGILLAPVTGHCLAEQILTGEMPEAARPFSLARFKPRSTNRKKPLLQSA
ncbi:glycine oxidase ThiO [Fodinicurvata halophila]